MSDVEVGTILLMIVFTGCGVCSLWTLRAHTRSNKTAWMKSVMLGWYAVTSFLSVVSVLLKDVYPETSRHWTSFYNAAGQLIALTGVVDVAQFAFCRRRLLRLSETNVLFVKVYVISIVTGLCSYVVFISVDNTVGASLSAYRFVTVIVIGVEAACYLWALIRLLASRRAAVYYSLSFASRVGILVAIIGRIFGFMSTQLTSFLHSSFVLLAVVPIGVFSIQVGRLASRRRQASYDSKAEGEPKYSIQVPEMLAASATDVDGKSERPISQRAVASGAVPAEHKIGSFVSVSERCVSGSYRSGRATHPPPEAPSNDLASADKRSRFRTQSRSDGPSVLFMSEFGVIGEESSFKPGAKDSLRSVWGSVHGGKGSVRGALCEGELSSSARRSLRSDGTNHSRLVRSTSAPSIGSSRHTDFMREQIVRGEFLADLKKQWFFGVN
uniref:Uncharacterized protein n=1 Tax=Chrysotila carterae TaxID=13221 RepID=A0A7S4EZ82_CHRCT